MYCFYLQCRISIVLCEALLQSLLVNDDAEDVPALPARPAWCQSEWRKWPESLFLHLMYWLTILSPKFIPAIKVKFKRECPFLDSKLGQLDSPTHSFELFGTIYVFIFMSWWSQLYRYLILITKALSIFLCVFFFSFLWRNRLTLEDLFVCEGVWFSFLENATNKCL